MDCKGVRQHQLIMSGEVVIVRMCAWWLLHDWGCVLAIIDNLQIGLV